MSKQSSDSLLSGRDDCPTSPTSSTEYLDALRDHVHRVGNIPTAEPGRLPPIYARSLREDVSLIQHQGIVYSLRPSESTLQHQRCSQSNDTNSRFRCFIYGGGGKDRDGMKLFAYRSQEEALSGSGRSSLDMTSPAVFIPLGHIVERESHPKYGTVPSRITNYVLLWNISTRPTSLWLAFDYYSADSERFFRHNRLGQPGDFDVAEEGYAGNNDQGLEFLESGEELCEDGAGRDQNTGPQDGVEEAETQAYFDHLKTAYAPDFVKVDNLEHVRIQVSIGKRPYRGSFRRCWAIPPRRQLFLGVRGPFDLGMLCSDTETWFAKRELDINAVKACLGKNSFHLGNRSRAVPPKNRWVELAHQMGPLVSPNDDKTELEIW
ncbi:hypothetical protein MMC28_009312 [Mycoblastus sanguinarius]|nr:hypothetical protein [Mycoblastus sanguinarius]